MWRMWYRTIIVFWATHVVHHSAENYNLTVSFRLSWIQHLKLAFILPVAFCGFHPVIFFIVNQISVLFQFWQHTEYIGRLPRIFELIFVTPSNHRVHHGSDEKYIDKNFGAIFIFWDKIFKTYVPEQEKPTYGITTKVPPTLDPLYLNFHEYKDIIADVKTARTWREKLFYIFGSPTKIARRKKPKQRQDLMPGRYSSSLSSFFPFPGSLPFSSVSFFSKFSLISFIRDDTGPSISSCGSGVCNVSGSGFEIG